MRMKSRKTDWPVFLISGGSLLLFVIAVILNKSYVEGAIDSSFAASIKYFWCLLAGFINWYICCCNVYGVFKIWES